MRLAATLLRAAITPFADAAALTPPLADACCRYCAPPLRHAAFTLRVDAADYRCRRHAADITPAITPLMPFIALLLHNWHGYNNTA